MVSVSTATIGPNRTSSGRSSLCSFGSLDIASFSTEVGGAETKKPAPRGRALRPSEPVHPTMVPRRRLELPRPLGHRYLKPARLPIPPPGQLGPLYYSGPARLSTANYG